MFKLVIFAFVNLGVLALVSSTSGSSSEAPVFEDSHVGYDLHSDYFYYDDSAANKAYSRAKYRSVPLITLGGQHENFIGFKAAPAVNPFAVAQMSSGLGDNSERWDVREANGFQFVGLYHGSGSNFVVNKLRAHLLRNVANSVTKSLEFLDNASESNLERIQSEIKHIIVTTFSELDEQIRSSMKANDDSSAEATIAIITKTSVIVAQVGNIRLLAYANNDETIDLTGVPIFVAGLREKPENNLFGLNKGKKTSVEANVVFQSREVFDIEGDPESLKFLLLESPLVASQKYDGSDVKIVLNEIQQHRYEPREERELFSSAVSRIVSEPLGSRDVLQKFFVGADAAVILVVLDRDYKSIH